MTFHESKFFERMMFQRKHARVDSIIAESFGVNDPSVDPQIHLFKIWDHKYGSVFWKCMHELPYYHKFRTAFRTRLICESYQTLVEAKVIDKQIRKDFIFHNYGDYGFAGLDKSLNLIKELGGSEESYFDPNIPGAYFRHDTIEDFKYDYSDSISTISDQSISLDSSNCLFNFIENLSRFTEIFPDGYTFIDFLLQQINVVVMCPEFYNFFTLIIDLI